MYGDVSRYGKVILFGMYHWNKIVSIEVGKLNHAKLFH